MTNLPEFDLAGWEVRTNARQQALYAMLECVLEMAQALQGLTSTWLPGTVANERVTSAQLELCARSISISIRKLFLDGNGSLLKRCVEKPNVHPLRRPCSFPPMKFVRPFGEQEFTFGWADGTSSDIVVPAFEQTITIHPLYGVRHKGGTQFGLYSPFDHESIPVKFPKWMSTKVIEIDGYQFSAEQLLRDMSNKEGAHIEENQAFVVPDDLRIDRDKNTLHRLANGVRFGSMTYLQMFSIYTGHYIVNRTRKMLRQLPFPRDNESVAYICETVSKTPRSIAIKNTEIQFTSIPLAVLGSNNELRGDYSSGIRSFLKVPE